MGTQVPVEFLMKPVKHSIKAEPPTLLQIPFGADMPIQGSIAMSQYFPSKPVLQMQPDMLSQDRAFLHN